MSLPAALAALPAVSLPEVLATAALQDRIDRKYLLQEHTALDLLGGLAGFRALEIEEVRLASYSTVYLDTPDLACHRAHLQGRRRRWKARTRRYLDSDLCRLELKTKGVRGRTLKACVDVACDEHGRLGPDGRAFLAGQLAAGYGVALPDDLGPVLDVRYRRATLVGAAQRVTLDTDLRVLLPDGTQVGGLQPGVVLVETKAGLSAGPADRALRRLGVRETSVSKYCAGTALARPDVPAAALRPLLRRWFAPAEELALAA